MRCALPLFSEGVKASPDNVAKAKYLVEKSKISREDVEAAFKACGMEMPALPDVKVGAFRPIWGEMGLFFTFVARFRTQLFG